MEIIKSRPVLADKLQLHISPDFLSIDDELEQYYDGHLLPFFEKEIQKLYCSKITRFNGVKNTSRPYLQLPNDFNPLTSQYIWNTRVSLRKPYTVVIDYNFIRSILNIVKNDPESSYDSNYHKSIKLHDDNFIDKKIWSKWDDVLIFDIGINLKNNVLEFANDTFCYIVADHELIYSIVSLKHAEFNIDYNVGSKNSLALILAFQQWIYSDRGRQWRSEIESISMVHHSANNDFDKPITSQDGHDGHTFKFNIAKGLSIKVYQKSDDHIRVEFVYDGSFIKQRFHKYDFDFVYPKLYEFSKELFKVINFEGVLYQLSKEISENRNDIESKMINVLERYDSELLNVINNIIHEQTISDPKTVSKIQNDSKLRRLFDSVLTDNGLRAYSYNPYHKDRPRRFRLLGKKLRPAKCGYCKMLYPTDEIRCPYCDEKNPAHELSKDPQFKAFMDNVNKYKEGGYRGL
jgi:hypothetical protein